MIVEKTDIFQNWINTLKDSKARIVITARIKRLENGNFGDCKFVGKKVYELRIDYAKGYRVYFINKHHNTPGNSTEYKNTYRLYHRRPYTGYLQGKV